jgi:hypothetical protein
MASGLKVFFGDILLLTRNELDRTICPLDNVNWNTNEREPFVEQMFTYGLTVRYAPSCLTGTQSRNPFPFVLVLETDSYTVPPGSGSYTKSRSYVSNGTLEYIVNICSFVSR